ncbi:MAG: hypothetical protein ACLU4N_02715 [Butyricimonas faecihominis]
MIEEVPIGWRRRVLVGDFRRGFRVVSRMLKLRGIKHSVLNAKLHQREADIVAEAGKSWLRLQPTCPVVVLTSS